MSFGYPEHDRWGLIRAIMPNLQLLSIPSLVGQQPKSPITAIRHPEYDYNFANWSKWRAIMQGGDEFNEEYIIKFSQRESETDFRARKRISPTPSFAKAAVIEVKNSIFQRIADITRSGGSKSYLDACSGLNSGVDLQGASMNFFLGHHVIENLLAMSKVGIFVDSPNYGLTLADKGNKHPYLYTYQAEDILSWNRTNGQLTAILLRDYIFVEDDETGLPESEVDRYRLLRRTPEGVTVTFYDTNGVKQDTTLLRIPKIPCVIPRISHSLLKDVANHQIALANLASSDLGFCGKANFPFYIEQVGDSNYNAIRAAQVSSTVVDETCPTESSPQRNMEVGTTQGRQYSKGLDAPAFINPSPEPLKASMERQEKWELEIRSLVHLALANLQPKSASEESKKMDNQGLEAGLSYIGLELQQAEREINDIWCMYEGNKPVTTITYPERWSLKSDEQVNKEVKELDEIRDSVPSKTFQKEITKRIAKVVVATKVSVETMTKINKEIEDAPAITADASVILADHKAGLLGDKMASELRGYPEGEVEVAKKDHAERAKRVLAAQTSPNDPGARGAPELSTNPAASQQEKEDKPQRGPAES